MATKAKTPAEMSVEEKLKHLYDLQRVLSRIDEIRTIRGELPLEVQDLSDEIEGMNLRISKLKDDLANTHLAITKWKEEKAQAQISIEKNTEHLNNVSGSREYDNLCKEIEFQQLEIQLRDKRISENIVRENDLLAAIENQENNLEEMKKQLEVKRQELEEIVAENRTEEDNLHEEAKKLEEKIEPRLLTAFKRIRKNSHNGLGVVPVERDSCGGCFAKIPPQRQLDVRFHKKIIVCEYCGRILVDAELAGLTQDKPEQKKTRKRRSTAKDKEKEA